MTLEAIKYENGKLKILDQLLLPEKSTYISINTVDDGWQAIHSMQVRGAPAIAIVGCLSLAVELYTKTFKSLEELQCYIQKQLNYLISARPTAVNMSKAAEDIIKVIKNPPLEEKVESLKEKVIKQIESMLEKDITDNKAIGKYGAQHILQHCTVKPIKVLTHCNTGSLATAGYGTALGVIRSLYEMESLNHAYCTETRPYNQGARLTAYELVHDKIPATLICDDMVAWLMTEKGISAVVVGGDRVAANGDTANKIGTYQLAIVAHHHKIPFYVAAPSTSCDLSLQSGSEITIEERSHQEMTHLRGMAIAAPGIGCWNPAFDVTPAELITGGIITEFGVFECCDLQSELKKHLSN